MDDLPTNEWIEVASSYQRLRRRTRRLTLAYGGSFFGFALLFGAAAGFDAPPFVAPMLFFLFLPTTIAFGLGSFVSSFALGWFPCPRCGKPFTMKKRFTMLPWRQWATDRCKHCGLDLGPESMSDQTLDSMSDQTLDAVENDRP